MSISRRLIDLARSELNSLLERAGRADEDDKWGGGGLDGLSDEELEEELKRRRDARDEAEQAAKRSRQGPASRAYERPPRGRTEPPRRTAAGDDAIRKAYAALEIPPGSDFETVRKSYRRMMRKYHPDLHTSSPEKQRTANDLTQRLTEAYKLLEKQLRR
jgi:DnaJ-domain-containing protein 1